MTDKKLDPADLAAITGRTLNDYDRFAESFWGAHAITTSARTSMHSCSTSRPIRRSPCSTSAVAWQRVNRYNYINHIN